jgi:hypothetical protein
VLAGAHDTVLSQIDTSHATIVYLRDTFFMSFSCLRLGPAFSRILAFASLLHTLPLLSLILNIFDEECKLRASSFVDFKQFSDVIGLFYPLNSQKPNLAWRSVASLCYKTDYRRFESR